MSGADYSKQIDPVYEKGLLPVFVVVYMRDDTGKDKDLAKTHNCAVPASLFACSHSFPHVQCRSFSRWMSMSGLPIPLFTVRSKLIESVRMMVCVAQLSPLKAIQHG